MEKRYLSRDAVKYIAMAAMLLNHVAHVFLQPETFLYELFVDIGYFTAVTMCYFLVEGYRYTRSVKNYAMRLFLFGVASQVPYYLAFEKLGVKNLNMMFTLFFCLLIIVVLDRVKNPSLRMPAAAGLALVTVFCDWAVLAALFTILFVQAQGSPEKVEKAYKTDVAVMGVYLLIGRAGKVPLWMNVLCAAGGMLSVAASGCCIVRFYNGKRAEKGKTFSKWFFYLFYPAHLLLLALVRYGR